MLLASIQWVDAKVLLNIETSHVRESSPSPSRIIQSQMPVALRLRSTMFPFGPINLTRA